MTAGSLKPTLKIMKNRKTVKPILFSEPMVNAILNGQKSQTRRIITAQSPEQSALMINILSGARKKENMSELLDNAPYRKGDILWVRETWRIGSWNHEENQIAFDYKASPEIIKTPWSDFEDSEKFNSLTERAMDELDKMGVEMVVDEENECFNYKWDAGKSPLKWKPSIHMPKEASRIFLKVTDVKIEELQEISTTDAIAEGITNHLSGYENYLWSGDPDFTDYEDITYRNPILSFKSLWQLINGTDSWELNPLVWAITFEKVVRPDNF